MEIFVDFGLFEILGIVALVSALRDGRAKRWLRNTLASAPAKLGRCVRCMTATALGLVTCWAAVMWLGPSGSRLVRVPLYIVTFGFTALAALHLLASMYRALDRLEERVSVAAGGCNCSGVTRRRPQRSRSTLVK